MNPEKWEKIKNQIKDDFEVIDERKEKLEGDRPGEKEVIIFNGPVGRMKLEFITKPLVIDKRAIASRRIGSKRKVKYIYSDTEYTHTLKAYRFNKDQEGWVEMEAGQSFKA